MRTSATTVKRLPTGRLVTRDAGNKLSILPDDPCEILASNAERTPSLLEFPEETDLLREIYDTKT